MFYWINRKLLVRKYGEEAVVIAEIRSHLHVFGHDTSHLSDEDIKHGANKISKAIAKTGISFEDASRALAGV